MKRKYILGIIAVLCVMIAGSIYHFSQVKVLANASPDIALTQYNKSQQDIVNGIVEDLKQKGVPIKSVKLDSKDELYPPIIVDFVIQSRSTNDKTAPGEVIYINLIGRAVNLAQRQGLNVGGIGFTFVNIHGDKLCWGFEPVKDTKQIMTDFDYPLIIDDETVSVLLNSDISFSDISLDKLDISQDEYGLRESFFELRVADIETANKDLPNLIDTIGVNISSLNTNQKTQISSYKIILSSAFGEPLLIYMNDLLLGSETWWQSNALTCEWATHPPQGIQY